MRHWAIRGRISRSAEWRLTAHFFDAMFDFGILTPQGADSFTHFLLGGIGSLIAVGLWQIRAYGIKYAVLAGTTPERYRTAVIGDDLFFIGLPMLLVALVTLLVSQSLFPDENDFRILGPLPIRRRVVVGAKFASMLAFTGLFAGVIHVALAPLMLLISLGRFREHAVLSRLTAWAVSSLAASLFSLLVIAAVVGVLMLFTSRTRMHALMTLSRSLMLAALVLVVPFVFRLAAMGSSMEQRVPWLTLLPPAWFVGLERVLLGTSDPWLTRLAGIAIAIFLISAAIVATVYIVLFKHFERLLLRPASASSGWLSRRREATSKAASGSARRSRRAMRSTTGFRAVHRFTTATFARSPLHQGVVLGLSACGLAIALKRLAGSHLIDRIVADEPASSTLIDIAIGMPFFVMFVCGISIRAALALPMTHRANWIFRLTESDPRRREQMRAVNHLVTSYVVGFPVAASVPVLWLALGTASAITAAVIITLVGLVFVHGVLLDWRRIPFTCSYLPGKRLAAYTVVLGFAAFALFTSFGALLVHLSMIKPSISLVIATILFASAWMLRRRRFAMWQETPLIFDDDLPDQPLQLGL